MLVFKLLSNDLGFYLFHLSQMSEINCHIPHNTWWWNIFYPLLLLKKKKNNQPNL